ncbi:MAG: sigma-54-dependent Fis family transcriptional regulator, partial [Fibrobacteres bacterium]|nr:sigma-54-dependent Fis family transcriptional regulator [Fibrobacterota bacterium]
QNFTIQKIGSNKTHKVHTRIITATNRNLQKMVDAGSFRADLFYRLNTISFELPPLREHATDIPTLSRFFLKNYNKRFNRSVKYISPEVDRFLMSHSWPGNIRELENTIQKAVLFCSDSTIDSSCIDFINANNKANVQQPEREPELEIPKGNARALQKEHILFLLKKTGGIVRWAAKEAEVGEATFFRKLRKFGINRE